MFIKYFLYSLSVHWSLFTTNCSTHNRQIILLINEPEPEHLFGGVILSFVAICTIDLSLSFEVPFVHRHTKGVNTKTNSDITLRYFN